jgi:hypothetical protein
MSCHPIRLLYVTPQLQQLRHQSPLLLLLRLMQPLVVVVVLGMPPNGQLRCRCCHREA